MLDPKSDTFVIKDFQFQSGETLAELRIHYRTLGELRTDGYGRVKNAVLIMHGTSGSGEAFLAPHFAGELFGDGQLLDLEKYFIILPDGIGHGGSSRPSDGLRANFPKYGYLDMVAAQHQLITEHLEIERLRLVMGTSMGGMHSWMWGYLHPEMVDALMPLVSLPVEIAGRNRMMRHMIFDAITQSPDYAGGNYAEQPFGLTAATHLVMLMVGSPYQLQKIAPTQQKADALFKQMVPGYRGRFDANDLLYQFSASHDYNPQPHLEKIIAPLTAINAADDLVNPPELGILEQEIGRVPKGKAVVLDNWPELQGHRSHSYPTLWKEHLSALLDKSEPQKLDRMLRKLSKSFLQSFWLPLVPGLVLITPFLSWDSVACTHDGHLHYHRVTALKIAWQNGLYFPRWVPDLAFGYGFPFFMYRESVPLYLTLFPHLAGMPLPAAENLFYAGCILFGGVFTYMWVRDFAGLLPAVVSSVAYMSAPYILIDALIRGNSPESMALAMVPLLLWAGRRLMISGRRRWFVTFVLSFAIFSLSHNISLLIYTPVIFLYMAVIGWVYRLDWKLLAWRLAPAFALALGMTAWYTGSAFTRNGCGDFVIDTSKRNNSFDFNWASWAEIFAQVPLSDPNLQNPPLPIRLGWMPSLLALIGTVRIFWGTGRRLWNGNGSEEPTSIQVASDVRATREIRWHAGLMLAAAAVFVFMSLPPSDWLWSNLPLIKFVQFPWRFVGRAALPLAVLAGLAFVNRRDENESFALTGRPTRPRLPLRNIQLFENKTLTYVMAVLPLLAISLLILEAIPYLYTRECREGGYPTVLDIFEYERNTGMVGVDPVGGYFPVTVAVRPSETPFEADYAAGLPPQRFDQAALPEEVQLISADYGNNRATIQLNAVEPLDTVEPFVGRYLTFAYPGWKVTADGQPLDIVPSEPEGLITFEVPAGTQQLDIWFGLTPFRIFLLVASGLALILFFVMWFPKFKPHNPPFIQTRAAGTAQVTTTSFRQTTYLPLQMIAVAGLVLLGGKLLLIDRQLTPLHRTVPPEVANGAELSAGEIRYIGYEVDRTSAESGGIFNIDVGLQTDIVPQNRYQTGIRLVGPDGRTWSVTDLQRPRIYEDLPFTTYWLPGYWGWDSWEISVLPGTPPGDYNIELTVFNRDTLVPQTLTAADGSIVGPTTIIGQMVIGKPTISPEIEPQYSADVAFVNEPIKLVGFNQSQADAVPGSPLLISLFLEKMAAGSSESLNLELVDGAGNSVQSWELVPGREAYFIPDWDVGDVVLSQHEVWLPADLASGDYRFQLEEISLEQVSVTAPPMLTTEPEFMMQTPNQKWENGIELVGFNTGEPGQSYEVQLIWRTEEFINTNYRVFIHVLDQEGNIEAQADGVPVNWARPTTGWRPGEFIVDTYVIELPEVAFLEKVFVGLYDPNTGARLKMVDGTDRYQIR